jgi:hypothetical protein
VITDSEVMLFERGLKVKRSDSVGYWWRIGRGKWLRQVASLILCGRFELWTENFGGKMP